MKKQTKKLFKGIEPFKQTFFFLIGKKFVIQK
jgi:hypothetical protein